MLSSGMLLAAVLIAFRRTKPISTETPQQGDLQIHSTAYGTNSANDLSVTDFLQKASSGGALSVWVGNNLIPGRPDPAPNLPKRLIVEYSYKNGERRKVERPEHTHLVLPEDSWLVAEIQRITQELNNERKFLTAKVQEEKETVAQTKQECARTLLREQEAYKHDVEQERNRRRPLVERAGALRSKAGQADWMFKRLEEIWHLYNNDPSNDEGPLAQPLAVHVIPMVIKEERHKQLWAFRVLYQSHISAVT